MINCKYDLLTCEYDNGNFIVYRPDSLSNVTAFQLRSTHFEPKPDVNNNIKTLHTSLSLSARNINAFGLKAAYDTLTIPSSIEGSFKLSRDVAYDDNVSAEENVKRVIKMYSDELKQWMFNLSLPAPQGEIQFNSEYVKNAVGGCLSDDIDPLISSYILNFTRYTASNAYFIGTPKLSKGGFKLLIPFYLYNHYNLTSPDTVTLSLPTYDNEFNTMVKLLAAMISPKMQYPDESRGREFNFNMTPPISFAVRVDGIRMHYNDFTSTSYPNGYITNIGVSLKTPKWNPTLLWTPGCMFWNRGGVNISFTGTSFSIGFCKYNEESSALTNAATVVYGDSEVVVNVEGLQLDDNHLASLIPMYHYEENAKNYFVTALFHNVKNVSAADQTSFKGLFVLCMETGEIVNASTGFNNKSFTLSSDFDVTDLLFMYGWQQYDEASEIGANTFNFTVSQEGVNSTYTFNKKRIEICPYKAFGNYYIVCDREKFDYWYVYDLDNHNIHTTTNIPVERNHCITVDGMHGFRFEDNNKTDFLNKDYYAYPQLHKYDSEVFNSIGLVRAVPLNIVCSSRQNHHSLFGWMPFGNKFILNFAYNPKQTFDPIDIDKTTAVYFINDNSPYDIGAMYFVVDITSDDGFVEFHHKRMLPQRKQFPPLQLVTTEYTLVNKTATTTIKPYNNIKVYINEFINNDTYVNNSDDVIDVNLKKSSITTTNQSFRIILFDENNTLITQDDLKQKYGVASIDLDFLF